jgi:hypothetical protein
MKRLLGIALLVATSARATPAPEDDVFSPEPSVRDLQKAAARLAEVHPDRVRSWLHRAGVAALLPSLRASVGRGSGELVRDALNQPIFTNSDTWRFEVQATWQLDRLVFDRNELRVSREAQRVGARREELLTRVAQLYFARRRLILDATKQPDAPNASDRALDIDELTAVLDGLTDGALSAGRRSP